MILWECQFCEGVQDELRKGSVCVCVCVCVCVRGGGNQEHELVRPHRKTQGPELAILAMATSAEMMK